MSSNPQKNGLISTIRPLGLSCISTKQEVSLRTLKLTVFNCYILNCSSILTTVWSPSNRHLLSKSNERLQAVVQKSTVCPSGSRALQSQTWLHKINARSFVDVSSYQTTRRNFLRRFCESRRHVWLRKAPESGGQTVDCCNTGWSPPYKFMP